MKNTPESLILSLQVAGFVAALGLLFFLHNKAQVLFSIAFSIHFAGDFLRFLKEGI
jgi:hypothetical protein